MAKPFPNHTVDCESLIGPCVEALKFAYKFTRVNKGKDIPYSGYNATLNQHILPTENERLSVEQLDRHGFKNDTALNEILNIVFLLGYEQGVKGERIKNHGMKQAIESFLDLIQTIEKEDE